MKSLRVAALATALFGCSDGGGFPDAAVADAAPPGGTFSLAWSLTDTQGGAIRSAASR